MLPDARGPASKPVFAIDTLAFRFPFAALGHRDLGPQFRGVIKLRPFNDNCAVCGGGGSSLEGQGLGAKQDPKWWRTSTEF
jgi:hypothetical protein